MVTALRLPSTAHVDDDLDDDRDLDAHPPDMVAWWNENRASLRELRSLGRAWGAETPPVQPASLYQHLRADRSNADAIGWFPTISERARIDLESQGAPRPWEGEAVVPSQLLGIVGGSWRDLDNLDSTTDGWRLFKKPPVATPEPVRAAIEHVAPLALALAVRSWDPCLAAAGIYDTRSYACSNAEMNRLRRAADEAAADAHVLEEIGKRHDRVRLLVEAEQLRGRHNELRAQLARLDREDGRTEKQTAVLIALGDPEGRERKLPWVIERAIKDARSRWWSPVVRRLRERDPRWESLGELARLLLADAWFVDLIPRTRWKHDGGGHLSSTLQNAIKEVDRRRKAARSSRSRR